MGATRCRTSANLREGFYQRTRSAADDATPPDTAVIVTFRAAPVNATVVTVKAALVAPTGTSTPGGRVAVVLSELPNWTKVPQAGAGLAICIVAVVFPPRTTDVGDKATDLVAISGGTVAIAFPTVVKPPVAIVTLPLTV